MEGAKAKTLKIAGCEINSNTLNLLLFQLQILGSRW